jgi:hypothetical protein
VTYFSYTKKFLWADPLE